MCGPNPKQKAIFHSLPWRCFAKETRFQVLAVLSGLLASLLLDNALKAAADIYFFDCLLKYKGKMTDI